MREVNKKVLETVFQSQQLSNPFPLSLPAPPLSFSFQTPFPVLPSLPFPPLHLQTVPELEEPSKKIVEPEGPIEEEIIIASFKEKPATEKGEPALMSLGQEQN